MKKDKALGRDPLGWIKATREAESRQAGEISKPEEQETPVTHIVNPPSRPKDGGFPTFGQTEIEKPIDVEDTVRSQEPEVGGQESRVTYERRVTSHKPSPVTSYERRVTNGSTIIFVVAYAVLLLVLTFFVYFNLSKRIDDMSSRISKIEKALTVLGKGSPF